MVKAVIGSYIYQPEPADKAPYIYALGNIGATVIKGVSKYEADRMLELLEITRGIKINENTKQKIEKRKTFPAKGE